MQWGGEVYNTQPGGNFTSTEMGSGYIDLGGNPDVTYSFCYNIGDFSGAGHSLYFGGPGYDYPTCS